MAILRLLWSLVSLHGLMRVVMRAWLRGLLPSLMLLPLLAGCSDPLTDSVLPVQPPSTELGTEPGIDPSETLTELAPAKSATRTVNEWHINAALESATELLQLVGTLNQTATDFADQPSASGLTRLQQQWRVGYQYYLQSLMQTASAPTISSSTQADLRKIHMTLDQWPITPGYIDAIDGYPLSGIVNDEALEMTTEAIRQQHQLLTDDTPSIGFSVLRFMLFGEEKNPRRWQDFIPANHQQDGHIFDDAVEHQAPIAYMRVSLTSDTDEQATNFDILVDYADRRLAYLTIVIEQLQHDSQRLVDYWQSYATNLAIKDASTTDIPVLSDARRSLLIHAQWLLQQRFWSPDGYISKERRMQMANVVVSLQRGLFDPTLPLIEAQHSAAAQMTDLLFDLAQQVTELDSRAESIDLDSEPLQLTVDQLQGLLTKLIRQR